MQENIPNNIQDPNLNPSPMKPKIDFIGFFKENKWPAILITGSILIVAVALFFALRKPKDNTPVQPKVSISIEVPDKIASGSEVIYKVHVQDSDSSAIKNVSIDLVYPNGFSFEDSTPKPTKLNGSQFGLPSLEPSQDTVIMIKGTIQGNAGETKAVSATMHYSLVNFNSDFVAQAQSQSQITTANVALDFSGQANTNPDQEETYSLSYANYTDKTITGFKITLTTPTGFVVSNYNPKPAFGSTHTLGDLAPNASGKINITGSFKNVNTGDQEIFTAKAEGSVDGSPSFALSAGQLQVSIAQIPLEANIAIDSSNKATDSVAPGDNLQYKITYKNNGSAAANGVIVTVKISGEALNLDQISTTGANVQNGTITWDASQNNGLESVGSGQGDSFTFSVPVKNPATRNNLKNLTIVAHTEIKSTEYNQPFIGPDLVTKVQTVADISKVVSFSSGQNPPVVGQTSTYFVVIGLNNQTNDVTAGKMTLNLPNAVNFDPTTINSDERANIVFDKNTKKITWTVDKLLAHAGGFVPPRKLQFSVSITPGTTQRGAPVTLVSNIKFSATDSFTSNSITLVADQIQTTDEPSGLGVVQ
ncbi:MAG: hypothetical protein JWO40_838 [Candidatus Doudnabacteria bacterium]|nr:hypothetical protein [Candidatus Doudnabacteria bacterium]